MRTAFALLTLAIVALAGPAQRAASATALSGELRVLYVLATWGPTPFTQAEAERVAAETDGFFRASSSGRVSMPGSIVGPLRLPRAVFDSCDATVLRNAAPAETFTGYDRIVFVTPSVGTCRFAGEANPTEVYLNGRLFMALTAHELGHTLGLGHASRWDCTGGRCTIDEYGSAFSVMGGGRGDFNAYEKAKLGWLTGILRPRANATYELGPVEGSTTLPQGFVVTTGTSEYWFESRGDVTPVFVGGSEQPPGVAVIAGPAPGATVSPYPRENLLLANPAGGARHAYVAGESFVRPGAFRVTVERHRRESAALGFEWLDRTAPGRPRLRVLERKRRVVRVTWDPAFEQGSGVQTYTLLVDGRAVRDLDGEIPFINSVATFRLPRGGHRVGVLATDRAGNRGRAAFVRIRVK
jgi:Gametolysin peptidase M11